MSPMSSTCHNCGESKTPDRYAEHLCSACEGAVVTSRDVAIKAGTDLGASRRAALASRARSVHNNRPNPRTPMSKADYWTAADPTGSESSNE